MNLLQELGNYFSELSFSKAVNISFVMGIAGAIVGIILGSSLNQNLFLSAIGFGVTSAVYSIMVCLTFYYVDKYSSTIICVIIGITYGAIGGLISGIFWDILFNNGITNVKGIMFFATGEAIILGLMGGALSRVNHEYNEAIAKLEKIIKDQESASISVQTLPLKPEVRFYIELPASIKMGEQVYGYIIIRNIGESAVLNVTTEIDGLSVVIPVFSRIEPKKEVKERFPIVFNSHGSKIIKVIVNYMDTTGKWYLVFDEKSIIVRGLLLKPAIVIEAPQALVRGEIASGRINIRNDGEEVIKDASLTVLVNGTEIKSGALGEIRPKKGTTIDIPIKTESERADLVANLKYKDILGNEYTYQERSSFSVRERAVFASTAVSYQGALILYKVKVENKLPKPISDVNIKAYVPDVFLIKENEKTIAMLEPNNARTVTFEIRPTGECGECNITGKINYYNNLNDKREDNDIPVRTVSIICPLLKVREISEHEWRNLTGSLIKAEEKTNEIPISARSLFSMVSDIIKDMNLYMLNPNVTDDSNFFRGVARFYGEGVKELKYAAQIEAIGGTKKSQLILKAYAEREDALTGFYYKVLDEIEKRMHVKEYIDNTIVQQYIHIDNRIGTKIEGDVVAVHSSIGAGSRNCPNCGREVEVNEKFCPECGAKL